MADAGISLRFIRTTLLVSQTIISGKSFEWSLVIGTTEFKPLLRLGDPDELDILRISLPGSGFDVAIRILTGQYSDGTRRFLGPLLVLGRAVGWGNRSAPQRLYGRYSR